MIVFVKKLKLFVDAKQMLNSDDLKCDVIANMPIKSAKSPNLLTNIAFSADLFA